MNEITEQTLEEYLSNEMYVVVKTNRRLVEPEKGTTQRTYEQTVEEIAKLNLRSEPFSNYFGIGVNSNKSIEEKVYEWNLKNSAK